MIEQAFREHWGQVLAGLVGSLGDLDLAEDALQDAFAIAATRWARDGVPRNPRAWLFVTARNRAIDRLRHERRTVSTAEVPEPAPSESEDEPMSDGPTFGDERLELIFMCCHPALAPDAQVALVLRTLGGLSTADVARALLVSEETMKRRLSRARAKIKATAIPFAVPSDRRLSERLAVVLAAIYLIFNAGYAGEAELAAEAIRLGRLVAGRLADQAEVLGLLALMVCHEARRAARFDGGELIVLGEQDRSLWDADALRQAADLLARARELGGDGPYVLQAEIATLQTRDPVDWSRIADTYARLEAVTGSPVVALNRAVAIAQAGSPERALALLETLELGDYQYLHSTRGELLRRLGRSAEARSAFERARQLAGSEPERRYLERQLAECSEPKN